MHKPITEDLLKLKMKVKVMEYNIHNGEYQPLEKSYDAFLWLLSPFPMYQCFKFVTLKI